MLCVPLWEVSASLSMLDDKITPRVGCEVDCGAIALLSLPNLPLKATCSAQESCGQAVHVQKPSLLPCTWPSHHALRSGIHLVSSSEPLWEEWWVPIAYSFGKHITRGQSPYIVATLKVLYAPGTRASLWWYINSTQLWGRVPFVLSNAPISLIWFTVFGVVGDVGYCLYDFRLLMLKRHYTITW